jgi:hypothetical protein
VRFRLPDPVLALPDDEWEAKTWQTEVMMQVEGLGAFIRALMPVRLVGGDTVTYGVWLGVHPEDLQRAFKVWWEPDYVNLRFEGLVANDVQPWGLIGKPVRALVRNPDETPYVDSSSDDEMSRVLTVEWEHDVVLDALPGDLGRA